MKVVVLASGGLDSSLLCLLLQNRGYDIKSIFINYGQLAFAREWEACQNAARYLSIDSPLYVDLSDFGAQIKSGLTTTEIDVANPYLPNRNLLFLVVASSYAVSANISNVAIGLLSSHVFPDQTREFIKSAELALRTSLGVNINVLVPLIGLNKYEVVRLAQHYNFPIHLTYSCHTGNETPCGRCISCLEIESALDALERS